MQIIWRDCHFSRLLTTFRGSFVFQHNNLHCHVWLPYPLQTSPTQISTSHRPNLRQGEVCLQWLDLQAGGLSIAVMCAWWLRPAAASSFFCFQSNFLILIVSSFFCIYLFQSCLSMPSIIRGLAQVKHQQDRRTALGETQGWPSAGQASSTFCGVR